MDLSPNQPYVLNYLGYAWTEQGRNLPRARQMIERAAAERPNDGAIADSLGWVMLQQGDRVDAVHWLERAVELDPEDSTVNGHLGDAYWASGRRMEAKAQWRRALILNPDPKEAAQLNAKLAGTPPSVPTGSNRVAWLTEQAPAKVNLTLQVTGRAANGYHLLDSLVVFGPAADILHAEPAVALTLTLRGPFAAGLAAEPDNLVLRAARALADWAGRAPGTALVLEKHLPVASGIGGGSADAAAALRLLARLWDVQPPPDTLAAMAAGLGADVPVCLASRPARMAGIGEGADRRARVAGLRPAAGESRPGRGDGGCVPGARTGGFSTPVEWPPGWPDAAAMARDLARAGQ